MSDKIRVHLVEDDEAFRLLMKKSLQGTGVVEIVAESTDGEEAINTAKRIEPDVILMDIGLPSLNGIESVRRIKSVVPGIKILMISGFSSENDVYASLTAGADGYCLKPIKVESLFLAVQAVCSGAVWIDPSLAKTILGPYQSKSSEVLKKTDADGRYALTAREIDVLRLICEGLTNQEIGERLNVTAETVKTHVGNILEKLMVSDRTQAAVKALREGYL